MEKIYEKGEADIARNVPPLHERRPCTENPAKEVMKRRIRKT
jgi:hypothetical protein